MLTLDEGKESLMYFENVNDLLLCFYREINILVMGVDKSESGCLFLDGIKVKPR
jgi:hypothetical protein